MPAIRLRNLIDLEKGEKLGKSFWKDADRKPSRETNGEEERKKGKKKKAIRGGNGEGSRKKRGGNAQQTSVLFLELMAKVYINNTHNSFEC